MKKPSKRNPDSESARIVIRFNEGTKSLSDVTSGKQLDEFKIGSWNKLLQNFPNSELKPMFAKKTN